MQNHNCDAARTASSQYLGTECVISVVWIQQRFQLLSVWCFYFLVHDVKLTSLAKPEWTMNGKCITTQQRCMEKVARNVHAHVA